jgi:hypothetical protein
VVLTVQPGGPRPRGVRRSVAALSVLVLFLTSCTAATQPPPGDPCPEGSQAPTAAASEASEQDAVSKPYPFDRATGVSTASDLAWAGPPGVGTTYDVYFGTSSDPPFVGDQSRIVYDPGVLQPETTYHWRVDATVGSEKFRGETYRFTTGAAPGHVPRPAQNGTVLLSDDFRSPSSGWAPIYLAGSSGGDYSISDGALKIETSAPDLIYGVYNTAPLSGHFYVEADYDIDDVAGLALIRQTNGQPDPCNYVMMSLSQDSGKVYVTANDVQDGVADVLGSDFGVPPDHYQVLLDGTQLSVPFVGTAKHFRIMHEALTGSFRYQFRVQGTLKGQAASGWMETWDSPDWAADPATQPYYVALLLKSGASSSAAVHLDNVRAVAKPTEDRDDTRTGFAVSHGEYNWSGNFGDATVVTFGDEFPFADQDRKFVFWSESNDVPFWHLSNETISFNEFVETWEDLNTPELDLLCFEPMSDRLGRFSTVQVLEDNAVRKVVRWSYDLVDPDYRFPGDPAGTQAAEAMETYTLYPDGTATREQRYTPKLDNGLDQQGNEVEETILGSGSKTWYADVLGRPGETIYNLEGDAIRYYPVSRIGDPATWNQFITSINLYDGAAPFVAYSHDPRTPDVFPYPVRLGVETNYDVSRRPEGAAHWPVQKAPYEYALWSQAYLTSEADSWSFSSAGNWAGGEPSPDAWDLQFKRVYQVDDRGRRYREWVSLIGMADAGDLDTPRDLVRSWLFPGRVVTHGADSVFIGNDRHQKTLAFDNTAHNGTLTFDLLPETSTINPAIEVRNWGGDATLRVTIDGVAQRPGTDYTVAMEGTSLLVWFHRTFTQKAAIAILD